jgi:myosin protein heavy chain
VALENQIKELNLRVVELETGSMTMRPRRFESRMDSLTAQLENEARSRNESLRTARKTDRMIRDLQFQLSESEKARARQKEDMEKMEQRIQRMRAQIEELVSKRYIYYVCGQLCATRMHWHHLTIVFYLM